MVRSRNTAEKPIVPRRKKARAADLESIVFFLAPWCQSCTARRIASRVDVMSCCSPSWRCTISPALFSTVITFEWMKPPLWSRLYLMPMQSSPMTLCRKQGKCHPCQGTQGLMHQPRASSVYDRDETEYDTLSPACDRVSEAGHILQVGACAIWRQVT